MMAISCSGARAAMLIGGWSLLRTGEHEMLDKRATHRDRKPLTVLR